MEFCTTERDGRVLTVTINRPERMNAVHPPLGFELDRVFTEFRDDPDLWVCILTGAGVALAAFFESRYSSCAPDASLLSASITNLQMNEHSWVSTAS